MATHSSILAWEIPWTWTLVGYSPWSRSRVGPNLATKQQQFQTCNYVKQCYYPPKDYSVLLIANHGGLITQ